MKQISENLSCQCPYPGLPIGGAVLAGVGLGWLIFYCKQRRKQRLQRLVSESTQATSKGITTNPSSKPLSTPPSTNFTRSAPSYPSSQSEFGRDSAYFGVQVFSYTDLEEATDNFNPSRELGDGGFGTVYYGKNTCTVYLHESQLIANMIPCYLELLKKPSCF